MKVKLSCECAWEAVRDWGGGVLSLKCPSCGGVINKVEKVFRGGSGDGSHRKR